MELSLFFYIPVILMMIALTAIPAAIGVYVYRDAKLRGMNALVWTLIAMLIPSFVGLIIYLIVRENYKGLMCPECGRGVTAAQAACTYCGADLKDKCPSCGAKVEPHYRVCPSCSVELPERGNDYHAVSSPGRSGALLVFAIIAAVLFPVIIVIFGFLFYMFSGMNFSSFISAAGLLGTVISPSLI